MHPYKQIVFWMSSLGETKWILRLAHFLEQWDDCLRSIFWVGHTRRSLSCSHGHEWNTLSLSNINGDCCHQSLVRPANHTDSSLSHRTSIKPSMKRRKVSLNPILDNFIQSPVSLMSTLENAEIWNPGLLTSDPVKRPVILFHEEFYGDTKISFLDLNDPIRQESLFIKSQNFDCLLLRCQN